MKADMAKLSGVDTSAARTTLSGIPVEPAYGAEHTPKINVAPPGR